MKTLNKIMAGCVLAGALSMAMNAQPTPPPPPGSFPPPVGNMPPPGPGNPPPPVAPPGWSTPGMLVTPPSGDWMNEGTMNVMATGYDTESVLVQIPLVVSYSFNGVNYDVTVLNAWSPYTQSWILDLDTPAYQTSYFFNGFTYNYYANLPSGTFYFNL